HLFTIRLAARFGPVRCPRMGKGRACAGRLLRRRGVTNTMNTPIEEIERSYPLLIEQYDLRPDSAGPGRHRGGSRIINHYQSLSDDITVTILSDRGRNRPQGLFEGAPGARTEVTLYKKDIGKTRKLRLPVKITVLLKKGDVIEIKTAGG